jgi:uncharacterized membrane protein YbhN (UPF0104 family)
MSVDCENYKLELTRKLNRTRGTRFRAYDRFTNLSKLSEITSAFLSSYLIIIAVIGILLSNFKNQYAEYIPYLTVGIALVLLVFNLTEAKKEYKMNAEKMHNCARELTRLHLKLTSICNLNLPEKDEINKYLDISKQYATILEKYEGHSGKDFQIFKVNHPSEFNLTRWQIFKYEYEYNYHQFIKYWILLYLPIPIMIIALICILK